MKLERTHRHEVVYRPLWLSFLHLDCLFLVIYRVSQCDLTFLTSWSHLWQIFCSIEWHRRERHVQSHRKAVPSLRMLSIAKPKTLFASRKSVSHLFVISRFWFVPFQLTVSDVELIEDECGKIRFTNVLVGKDLLNGTETLPYGLKDECQPARKNDLCLLSGRKSLKDQSMSLDSNTFLINSKCDISQCNFGSSAFRQASDSSTEKPSSDPNENGARQNDPDAEKSDEKNSRKSQKDKSLNGMERSVNVSDFSIYFRKVIDTCNSH